MKRNLVLPGISLFLTFFLSCANRLEPPVVWADDSTSDTSLAIQNLSLKYSLVDTAYQFYMVFVRNDDLRKTTYSRNLPETWLWMQRSWSFFSPEMRGDLSYCMKRVHPWMILENLTALPDDAGIDEIISRIEGSSLPEGYRIRFARFFRSFYFDFYAAHYDYVRSALVDQVKELTIQSTEFTFGSGKNILEYMEEKLGLRFPVRRKPVLYLLEFSIGAYGFETPNRKISTVQTGADDLRILYATAFHEYSHELFRPIERSSRFKSIAAKLKKNHTLFSSWDADMRANYTWEGYIAENVVNGLSYYLMYEYTNKIQTAGDYVFDDDLCRFLVMLPYVPATMRLEDVIFDYLLRL